MLITYNIVDSRSRSRWTDHGVHDEGNGHEESHNDGQHPVEEQHEEVVGRTAIKDSCLQPQAEKSGVELFRWEHVELLNNSKYS